MNRPADDAKRRKKEQLKGWKAEQLRKLRESLPLGDDAFEAFFNLLDQELVPRGCDHTRRLSREILESQGRGDQVETVFAWFDGHSDFRDCEVLANTEEVWRSTR